MEKDGLLRKVLLLLIPFITIATLVVAIVFGTQTSKGDAGVSILSVLKTDTKGNVDTYTITYSDGTTSTFTVTNGTTGKDGEPGKDGYSPQIDIGENGNWYVDNVDTGVPSQGSKGDTGVSITGTSINDDGDLIVSFSNGSSVNAGHIKDILCYTVKYHLDGEVIMNKAVENNAKINEPTAAYTSGYSIDYWYTTNGITEHKWNFDEFVVNEDLDLYAKSSPIQYKISFKDYKNGIVVPDKSVLFNRTYSLPTLEEDGYKFMYWSDSKGKEFSLSGTYALADNTTLYAVWKNGGSTVTLNPNGGVLENMTISIDYDSLYTLPVPTHDTNSFIGWYDSDDNYVNLKSIWKHYDDLTLTAKWSSSDNYVFETLGGICSDVDIDLTIGNAYSLPTPTMTNYIFDGWEIGNNIIPSSGTWSYIGKERILKANWHHSALTYEETDGVYEITACDKHASGEMIIFGSYCGGSVKSIGNSSFSNCRELTRLFVEDGVESIGEFAFTGCYGLTKVDLADSISNISHHAFYYCTSLTDLEIPSTLTVLKNNVFGHCDKLREITLPKTLTRIEQASFDCCSMFSNVYFKGTQEEWLLVTIIYEYNSVLLTANISFI